jgi:hypothetical protein
MLLKYLNELDAAVQSAKAHPDSAHVSRCIECATVLEAYLQGQMEPVRRKGEALMRELWPQDLPRPAASSTRAVIH